MDAGFFERTPGLRPRRRRPGRGLRLAVALALLTIAYLAGAIFGLPKFAAAELPGPPWTPPRATVPAETRAPLPSRPAGRAGSSGNPGSQPAATDPHAEGPLPACTFGDVPAPHASYDDWARTLLDTEYRLPASYAPPDLVSVSEAGIAGPGLVRSFVVDDLAAMTAAAKRDGVVLSVSSAYRSYADQEKTFASIEAANGKDYALVSAARPGHSEHQLGTTIDFDGGDEWLAANAWEFGFASSYPAASSPDRTCYKPEPWHYRYFGRETAAAMHGSGLSPREWLWRAEN